MTSATSSSPKKSSTTTIGAVKTEEDLGKCVSLPISDKNILIFLKYVRTLPEFRFIISDQQPARTATNEMKRQELRNWIATKWTPPDFYKCCFELEVDPRIASRIKAMLDKERLDILSGNAQVSKYDRSGFIYVFHFLSDPITILKIGKTIRTPEERRAEWERELAPEEGQSVVLLFAYRTIANSFAESIIHTLLTCQHSTGRINPLTNDRLEEFFEIRNVMALKVFIRQTLLYIDRFSRYWRGQRGSRAALELPRSSSISTKKFFPKK